MKYTNAWMSAALLAAFALSPATRAAQPAAPPAPPAAQAAPADANADTERQLAAARERLETAAHEVAELSSRLGENVSLRFMQRGAQAPRAMLGVQIDGRSGSGGAHVMAVSPGGAAAAAGIEADDVITAIDGDDLSKAPDAARALVDRMRELKPDTQVKLRVAHAGKVREVEVTPRAPPPGMAAFAGPMPGMAPPGGGMIEERRIVRRGPDGEPQTQIFPFRGPGPDGPMSFQREAREFQGLELATLSARLGGYFGAKAGVLVVRAGGSQLKLEDGDVITAIDGREPTSATHATRILRSYQAGEKVVLKLVRDHKAQQVEVVMEGRGPRPERGPPLPPPPPPAERRH
jgi:S1-C subfamily serine protease